MGMDQRDLADMPSAPTPTPGAVSRALNHKYFYEIALAAVLVVISVALSFMTPFFMTTQNLLNVLQQVSLTAIVAFGMAFVIISQGIDLSVGAGIALVGVPAAKVVVALDGTALAIGLGILAGIAVGALIGLANGLLIVKARMPSFIATLATMSIARGVALTWTQGQPVFGLPKGFIYLGNGFVGPIPFTVIVMIVVFALAVWVTEFTSFGRTVYAIGGNEEAARLSGINVNRNRIVIYMISGMSVGIVGVMFTGLLASAQPTAGDPFLFSSITAAILGGVALFGGSGRMVGVLIGALLIGVVANGQALLNVDPFLQQVIMGLVVLLAIAVSGLQRGGGQTA